MNAQPQIVLVHMASHSAPQSSLPSAAAAHPLAQPAAAHPLAQALRQLGATVREVPLAAPYDALLDAIAEGFVPVACKPPPAGRSP